MDRKTNLAAAALAALAMSGCKSTDNVAANSSTASAPTTTGAKGECWGVNACKGQGACGGVGHECAGQNECKGQGWLSLTKTDCDGRNGKFKAK